MADEEQVALLKAGVIDWNQWRKERIIIPDLKEAFLREARLREANLSVADLNKANLEEADLSRAILIGADLRKTDLRGASLRGGNLNRGILIGADLRRANLVKATLCRAELREANLSVADLNKANLEEADLSRAILSRATFIGADLTGATLSRATLTGTILSRGTLIGTDLTGADLRGANLRGAILTGVDLRSVTLGSTSFNECVSLHEAQSLTEVWHQGPSFLDVQTLRTCVTRLPDKFLLGVGYTLHEIGYLRDLYRDPIEYYSCFLSHAEADGEFADRLRDSLLMNDVSCWYYKYDLRGGRHWEPQINAAIKHHDKLVIACSENALLRPNVVKEIIHAIEREQKTGKQKLFPLRLDDYIFSEEMKKIAERKVLSGEWSMNWVEYVKEYQVVDFRGWKDHDEYQLRLQQLLRDLKTPPSRSRTGKKAT